MLKVERQQAEWKMFSNLVVPRKWQCTMAPKSFRKLTYFRSMGLAFVRFKIRALASGIPTAVGFQPEDFRGVGLEIGGPSSTFKTGNVVPVYDHAERIDNVTFSLNTRWEGDVAEGKTFVFDPLKAPGTQFILEGGELSSIPRNTYDFVLSSHMLEHTANPLKVLASWKELLKPGGKLVVVLPHRDSSFDHLRPVTTIAHMVDDFTNDRSESDNTHFEEVLRLHDLRRDLGQSNAQEFRKWIYANEVNRGVHHHVFDLRVVVQLLDRAGFQVTAAESMMPLHIVVFATKAPDETNTVDNAEFLDTSSDSYQSSPFRSDRMLQLVA